MGETWHRVLPAESFIEQDMERCAREPFFAADHVADLHEVVVHDIGEVVCRQFVGAFVEHFVVQDTGVDFHIPANEVVNVNFHVWLYLEAHGVLRTVGDEAFGFFLPQCERIAHLHTCGGIVLEVTDFFALLLELFGRIEGDISLSFRQQLLHIFLINVATLALAIRPFISSEANAFIKVDAEPFEALEDIVLCSRNKAVGVGVFYTKNEFSSVLASKQIIIKSGTYATDMKRSCRTRRKTHADILFCHVSFSIFIFNCKNTYLDFRKQNKRR